MYVKSNKNTSLPGKNLVTIAPSTNKSSDINFCVENVFYDQQKKNTHSKFFSFDTLYQTCTAKPQEYRIAACRMYKI